MQHIIFSTFKKKDFRKKKIMRWPIGSDTWQNMAKRVKRKFLNFFRKKSIT